MRHIVASFGALAAFAAVAPLYAQAAKSASIPLVEVAPYAGYLVASDLIAGPLGTRITSGSGALYGAQLSVPVNRYLAAVGNVAYSKGDLSIGLPLVGGIDVGRSATWLYDGGLQVSAPEMTRGHGALVPFAQVGVGALHRTIDVNVLSTKSTNLAWNAGAGADLALGSGVALRFLAKDYIGRFDVQEATGVDAEPKVTHSWALSAGLKVAF
jgi:hypothetical protein